VPVSAFLSFLLVITITITVFYSYYSRAVRNIMPDFFRNCNLLVEPPRAAAFRPVVGAAWTWTRLQRDHNPKYGICKLRPRDSQMVETQPDSSHHANRICMCVLTQINH
jgi:hypothetical protein